MHCWFHPQLQINVVCGAIWSYLPTTLLNAATFLTDDAALRWNEGISTMIQARLQTLAGTEDIFKWDSVVAKEILITRLLQSLEGKHLPSSCRVSSIHESFDSRQEKPSFFCKGMQSGLVPFHKTPSLRSRHQHLTKIWRVGGGHVGLRVEDVRANRRKNPSA